MKIRLKQTKLENLNMTTIVCKTYLLIIFLQIEKLQIFIYDLFKLTFTYLKYVPTKFHDIMLMALYFETP